MKVSLSINGQRTAPEVPANLLLSDYLRETLKLTGTHIGCDTSQCGACTVLMAGKPVKACTLLVAQCEGAEITTIEALAGGGELHPIQRAFNEHHGLQCGFCTPGMVLAAKGIIDRHGDPDEETIRRELDGNLCRCTGYQNIVTAIRAAAKEMRGA